MTETAIEKAAEPVTALATIAKLTPMQLFATGTMNPIIDSIKAHVRSTKRDISTESGRKAIRSMVRDIQSSRAFVEEQRVALVGDEKKRLALIDAEGKRFRDEMETLWKEFRAPLTAWEDSEKERCAENERRIATMLQLAMQSFNSLAAIELSTFTLDELHNHNFQEFTERATEAREKAALRLDSENKRIAQEVTDRLERSRLKAEAEEKARVERENKIAEDARLKAEAEATRLREAEAAAAKQREQDLLRTAAEEKSRLEREKADGEERLRKLRESIETARVAALERERKAEADRVATEEQAKADRAAERERAKSERENAVQAERKRNEDIRLAEEAQRDALAREKATREADQTHRQTVLKNAHAALVANVHDLTSGQCRAVIVAISKGLIPGVSVNY